MRHVAPPSSLRRAWRPLLVGLGSWLAVAALLAGLRGSRPLCPANTLRADEPRWKVGPAFEQQLRQPVGVTWPSNPIRATLQRFAANEQVAIVLDRRVDPSRKATFAARNATVEQVLDAFARQEGLGVSYVGAVVYLGPPDTTRRLATVAALLHEGAQALPPPARNKLLAATPCQWDELSSPRDLVRQAVEQAGLRLFAPERVPHDLWPAGSLPPLSLIDKLTVLLAGFDLSLEVSPDGSAIRPVPLPESPALTRPLVARRGEVDSLAALAERFPQVRLVRQGERLVGTGLVEDLRAVERHLAGERPPQPVAPNVPGARRVFTLTVENQSVGGLLRAVAKQLEMQVEFAPGLDDLLEHRVSFRVQNAALDELLRTATAPAGLRCTVQGNTIRVTKP